MEHIIPRTLIDGWDLDPAGQETAPFRAWLCPSSNAAGSAWHSRPEVLKFIRTGHARTAATYKQFADWAAWVTMLLGLTKEHSTWPRDEALALLRDRLPCRPGVKPRRSTPPKGTRVYTALANENAPTGGPYYAVALRRDPRVILDYLGEPVGLSVTSDATLNAASVIRLGAIVTLVIGPTWESDGDHRKAMDQVAAAAGLLPMPPAGHARMGPQLVDLQSLVDLFTTDPLRQGTRVDLLPRNLRVGVTAFAER